MATEAVATSVNNLKPGQTLKGADLERTIEQLTSGRVSINDTLKALFQLKVEEGDASRLIEAGVAWLSNRTPNGSAGAELVSIGTAKRLWSEFTQPGDRQEGPGQAPIFVSAGSVILADGSDVSVDEQTSTTKKGLKNSLQASLAEKLITDYSAQIRASIESQEATSQVDSFAELSATVDMKSKERLHNFLAKNQKAMLRTQSGEIALADIKVDYIEAVKIGEVWQTAGLLRKVKNNDFVFTGGNVSARSKGAAEQLAAAELLAYLEEKAALPKKENSGGSEISGEKPIQVVNGDFRGALTTYCMRKAKTPPEIIEQQEKPGEPWKVSFKLIGEPLGEGSATKKSEAIQIAAKNALEYFGVEFSTR